MKDINVDSLIKMLQNMDKKTLEANIAKAQEILKNKKWKAGNSDLAKDDLCYFKKQGSYAL